MHVWDRQPALEIFWVTYLFQYKLPNWGTYTNIDDFTPHISIPIKCKVPAHNVPEHNTSWMLFKISSEHSVVITQSDHDKDSFQIDNNVQN